MRLGSEDFQVLAGELWIGHGEEFFFDPGFCREIAITGSSLGNRLRKRMRQLSSKSHYHNEGKHTERLSLHG